MKQETPLVSVLMPAFNVEDYIAESIESVLNQTYTNWELIIINDGSTDNTQQIIDGFQKKNSRIKVFENDGNQGLIYTRNRGLEEVKGKYIANLDSDDVALPNRLSKQVEFLEKNTNYILLGAACIHINKEGEKIENVARNIPDAHLKSLLLFSNYFINSTVMFRAESMQGLKYEKGYAPAEDYELFSRIGQYGKIGNLPDYLVKYRIHDSNISSLKKKEQEKAIATIIKNQLQRLEVIPTERELAIQTSLVSGPYSNLDLAEVEKWLLKLIEQNKKLEKYPEKIFNYYCAFFYRRVCENSKLGIKAIRNFKKSPLSRYITGDLRGNSAFFVKSLFRLS